jgi:signal transduction histidine kinase
MRWPQSLRARLTLWYTLVLGAPLVAFAGASFLVLDRALLHRADAFLDETLGAFTTELQSEQHEEATAQRAIDASLHDVQFRDVRLAVFDSLGRLVAAGNVDTSARFALQHPVDLTRVGAELHARLDHARDVFTITPGSRGYRVAAEPVSVFGARYLVAAAYPVHHDHETMEAVGTTYLIAIPLLLLIAAVGGYFMAARNLSPVERAFALQRRFMADASHELRTPVAVLRTEADVTLSRSSRTEAEYRESVAVMRDSARRLGRIVDDLFLLARADAGHLPIRRESLYLEDVVDEAARTVRSLAQERGVRVELLPLDDSPFDGDPDLLGRVLLNLLDNAIKHSPAGGTVTLALTRHPLEYHICVTDEGPGIPADAQAQIFERFYRADKSRPRDKRDETSGAGLGLAIGRWIAEAHGGRLDLVRSDSRGTEFRLALPTPRSGPSPADHVGEPADGDVSPSFTASER